MIHIQKFRSLCIEEGEESGHMINVFDTDVCVLGWKLPCQEFANKTTIDTHYKRWRHGASERVCSWYWGETMRRICVGCRCVKSHLHNWFVVEHLQSRKPLNDISIDHRDEVNGARHSGQGGRTVGTVPYLRDHCP